MWGVRQDLAMYFSPNSFPHLVDLPEKERKEIVESCHTSSVGLYLAGIIFLVLLVVSIATSLMEGVGVGRTVSIFFSTLFLVVIVILIYVIYINRYLYPKTMARLQERKH
jgi:hypothetical protein